MTFSFSTPGHEEIWQIVEVINDSWVSGRLDRLDNLFISNAPSISPWKKVLLRKKNLDNTCRAGNAAT